MNDSNNWLDNLDFTGCLSRLFSLLLKLAILLILIDFIFS